jgi:peptide/nickel transport system ATP-binding protein
LINTMSPNHKEALLDVTELTVYFNTDRGEVKALDRVELSVAKGEIVGLIGESGSGKTTIARSILGVLPPAGKVMGGSIRFARQHLLKMSEARLNSDVRGKGITLIPQDPFNSLNPVFKVGTQIRDIMKWKGNGGKGSGVAEDKIIAMLEKVQIPAPANQLKKFPHQFSGGQRQRFMIAMALLPGPDLVIADEPTTALDVTVEAQILKLMTGLVLEGSISVLFITHDLAVASQICKKIVVMYAGQDMEDAPADVIFSRASHPYTRELLESLPNPEGNIRDIPGEVPSLVNPPPGCRFHPRCSRATSRCSSRAPDRTAVGENHWVRCFHPMG